MSRRAVLAVLVAAAFACAGFLACGEADPERMTTSLTDTRATARKAWEGFFRPPTDRVPHELATNPGEPWGDYLGSESCRPCHAQAYAEWRDSYHSRTLYDAAPKTVFGDFSGTAVYDDPRYVSIVKPWSSGGRFGMTITKRAVAERPEDTYGAGVPERSVGNFEVLYAFGNRRHQPYVARTEDGRYWVLPIYWNDVTKSWMWDGWRPYVTSCAHCHVTGIRSSSEPGPGAVELPMTNPRRWNLPSSREGWAEGSVGCEVCHGPGRRHVDTVRRMGNVEYRRYLENGGEPTIYDPAKDTPENRMRQCDTCHNFHSESSVTFVPGPNGYDHDLVHRPITPRNSPGQFWDDGTDMSPCTVGRVFRQSKMGRSGKVECGDCHDAHGNADWAELVRPLEGNRLCLHCHEKAFPNDAAIEAHTHHPARGPGSLCHECHMPRDKRFTNGVQVMSAQIHSHAFTSPTGDEDARHGPGPSCNTCHHDRDAAWTKAVLRAWKEGKPPPK